MAVSIQAGDSFGTGTPARLFRHESLTSHFFDVSADGQHFIVSSGAVQAQSMPFAVVINWPADLKRPLR
jgi:hypothetical protein